MFCTAVLLMAVCGNSESQPLLDAERWKNFGVAHLEQEEPNDAVDAFRKVIALAPTEEPGSSSLWRPIPSGFPAPGPGSSARERRWG